MALSREDILALRPPVETLEIEGHGKVSVRGLTAEERDDYEQTLIETGPNGSSRVRRRNPNIRAALVVRCLIDEKGERLFGDKDVGALGKVDSAFVNKCWETARRLSGMNVPEEAEVEAFDTAQDDGNSSE